MNKLVQKKENYAAHETAIVLLAYAIIEPKTVMVKVVYAFVTSRTMF